jgi:hypothetical protein
MGFLWHCILFLYCLPRFILNHRVLPKNVIIRIIRQPFTQYSSMIIRIIRQPATQYFNMIIRIIRQPATQYFNMIIRIIRQPATAMQYSNS